MRFNVALHLMNMILAVQGWPCTSSVTEVFTTTGTNAVLQFTADLSNLNTPRSFEVKFHDNTALCRIRYAIDKTTSGSCAVGVRFTGDRDGNIAVTLQNVQQNDAGFYFLSTAGYQTRCNCLYILGVPTKPVITINGTPSVGDTSSLTCISTSTTSPSNHSLTMVYNWKVDNDNNTTGTKYSYSTGRKYLYISNIGKEDANKQLTCTAREDVSDGYTSSRSDVFSFDVYSGPEHMSLSPSDVKYEGEENAALSQIMCKANCHPTCSFRWTKVGQVTDVSNTAVLDLGSLSATKSGTYICTATRSNSVTQSINFTVNVIYGPRNMNFSPSTLSYRRDENYNLPPLTCGSECWSCGYSWTGPNSHSTTGQVLDLPGLTKSMTGNYTCTATNTKLSPQRHQDKSVQIEVRYGPDSVSLTSGKTMYTVDEGSTLSDIKCEADCFPACKNRWIKDRQTVSNTDTLTLGQVEKSDAGRYTCRATNGDNTTRWLDKTITIEVRYGPYQSSTNLSPSTQQYTMNEDQNLQDIKCSADCFPNCIYTWTKTKQGQTITVSNTSVLSLASLHRDEAATYTCTAVNPGKSVSPKTTKQVIVQVRYGPNEANINAHSPYYITEGDTNIVIKCSSDCFPGCSYTWSNLTSGSIISSNNGVLPLSSVTRYMTGNYRCDSSNTASQYTKAAISIVNTVVKYAPAVIILRSELNSREGDSLTIYCNGSGVPSNYSYISLAQSVNGVVIQNTNAEMTGTPKFSSIHFSSLKYQDTGTYTCTLNNGIKDISGSLNQIGASNLLVKGSPKIFTFDLRFVVSAHGIVQIPVYSYPKLVTTTVERYDGYLISNDKFTVEDDIVMAKFYGKYVSLNGSVFKMVFDNLQESDVGNYSLKLTNTMGTTSVIFSLTGTDKPSPPSNFRMFADLTIPTFVWSKNDNGGLAQTFVIQISVAGTGVWRNHTYISEDDQQYQINDTFYLAKINSLPPGVYVARIFSYNKQGVSVNVYLGTTFDVSIKRGSEKQEQNSSIVPIAAGISSTFFVLICVAIAVFVLVIRRMKGQTGKEDNKTNESGQSTDMQYENFHGVMETDSSQMYDSLDARNTELNTYDSITAAKDRRTGRDTEKVYENLKIEDTT